MLIQHRLVAQRRPAFGNEYQPAFAPREMLFQHFRYVRLNVDCPSRVVVFGTLWHPTPHAKPHVHHVAVTINIIHVKPVQFPRAHSSFSGQGKQRLVLAGSRGKNCRNFRGTVATCFLFFIYVGRLVNFPLAELNPQGQLKCTHDTAHRLG